MKSELKKYLNEEGEIDVELVEEEIRPIFERHRADEIAEQVYWEMQDPEQYSEEEDGRSPEDYRQDRIEEIEHETDEDDEDEIQQQVKDRVRELEEEMELEGDFYA